jgi:hypothetical protein
LTQNSDELPDVIVQQSERTILGWPQSSTTRRVAAMYKKSESPIRLGKQSLAAQRLEKHDAARTILLASPLSSRPASDDIDHSVFAKRCISERKKRVPVRIAVEFSKAINNAAANAKRAGDFLTSGIQEAQIPFVISIPRKSNDKLMHELRQSLFSTEIVQLRY